MNITSKTADEIDEAREKEYVKKVEAIFFISGRFLSMQELISFSDLNPIIIREIIEKLKERYNKEDSAIEIVEREGSWKMDIRKEFSDTVNRLATGSSEFSKAERETLAIIAYKQPIKQSIIIKIRGNKAYDHIKKFIEIGLVRKKKVGHTNELSLLKNSTIISTYQILKIFLRKRDNGYLLHSSLHNHIHRFVCNFLLLAKLRNIKKGNIPQEAEDKTVSILIPAYNEAESIGKTIESALALDYPKEKLEIIVIDDGSKDDTFKLAKKYKSNKWPKVRIFSKSNGGKGSALNLGISKAENEIIVSMDADTFVQKNALKKMIACFYSDKIMSVTPSMGVYKPESILQRIQQIEYYMGNFLRKSFAIVDSIHVTPGAFSAYRKEFFQKHGGYDVGNITEDLEIALRIQKLGYRIENAPEAVVYTIVPKTFKALIIQRRRWYTGLTKNLYHYKELFGIKKRYPWNDCTPPGSNINRVFNCLYILCNHKSYFTSPH